MDNKKKRKNNISTIDKKNLLKLADDFLLLRKKETFTRINNIIATCKSYEEARRKIMSIYDDEYSDCATH